MKSTLVLAVAVCVYLTQVSHGATIASVQNRIVQEQSYLQSLYDTERSNVLQTIANERSTANTKAEGMKTQMRNGAATCQVWISQIESIQRSSINFRFHFQVCELDRSPVSNLQITFFNLKKSADRVQALCGAGIGNCQSQVDGLDSSLDTIHNNVVNGINANKVKSNNCITGRVIEINKQLDSSYNFWTKCS